MSSTVEITTKLQRQFGIHYRNTFLFTPKFIQEDMYIDSQLRIDEPRERILNLNEFCDKVIEGVERSFLILGDSGSGKTSFALKLCQTLWGKSKLVDKVIIPVYVHLPSLVTKLNRSDGGSDSELNIVKILVEEFGIDGIEVCEGQIVLILDSYDEISSFPKPSRIVQNIWRNTSLWPAQVSVLTCSRPEAVPKLKRQELFEFVKFGHVGNRKYSEYALEGLSGDRISHFLEKMEVDIIPKLRILKDEELFRWSAWGALKGKIQDWKLGDYNQWFQDLPDLRKLSRNPYILTLICQALPGIVLKLKNEEKELKRLCKTRVGIFHSFTEQIFEYQAHRVSQRPDNLQPGAQNISYRDWLIYFRAYAQNLSGKWFNNVNEDSFIKMSDQETLDSSLVEPVLNIAQLEKLEKDHKDLFPPRLTHYEEIKCPTTDKSNPLQTQNMRILRDACNGSILVYSANENEYTFIHRSLLEYFASEQAFESSLAEYDLILGQNMDNSSTIYGKTGFSRALIKDRDILSQLVERMSIEYKKILFKLIRVSKRDSKLHRISANAITILNKTLVSFSGQDYRDIQIQGADLRQSICAHTDFRGANLSNVQFGESYLVGAQFQGACMENIDFGESPSLKLSSKLNSVVSFRDKKNEEDNWVVATRDGAVRIWNTLEEKSVRPQCQDKISSYAVDTRLSLLDGKVAVWTESTKYPRTPLSTTMVTYEVSVYCLFPNWMLFQKHTLRTREGVDQIYSQFCPIDKYVFVYSTCHLEVLSYLPTSDGDTNNLITIGDGDPNKILTFASIVDKNGDILVACHENYAETNEGRLVVYKYVKESNNFQVVHSFARDPFSGGAEKYKYGRFDRILFKPDGSGLAIFNELGHNLQILENYSEIITPVHSDEGLFITLVFDRAGKYLAGFTMNTYTITIWNVPTGTIHRQFGVSIVYPFRFSNPLAFSSDSKVIAFAGSEFHSDVTMNLKSIDENPSISDLARPKPVDDVAVSDDGQIVVIVGKHYHTSHKCNYIEIFTFPFQTISGLCVRLPNDMSSDSDLCITGIINSKKFQNSDSKLSKKIIVIQKEYCRAVVICAHTGSILQYLRFEDTLDISTDRVCCVNKQTSLCCIYSPTQGYFFWEIFENDNFEIIFQRKNELENVSSKIDVKVEDLSFDCTGRYLPLVSDPLSHETELGKIILLDTQERTVKEINVDLCTGTKILIQSVDTDITNNIIFACSFEQLHIFNPFGQTLSQKVEYNFSGFSQLHFDPNSGWLFANCRLNSCIVIFQKKNCQWGLALEIPLWFMTKRCLIYETNNKISVLIGGQGNLCYFEFDKGDCRSWKLLWSMKHCHKLKSMASNVEGALRLSKRNTSVLKGLGASGEPQENIKSQYLPFSDWCQEIFGTARSKFPSPFVKTAENNFSLSEDMWIVSLVGNLSNKRKWRAHVYFIVEGIKNNRRFITRIHLTYSKKLKEVSLVVSPVVDRTPTPLNDHSWEDSKYIEFVHLADKLSTQQYGMRSEECEQFLTNIQSDMQVKLDYNMLTQNCGVWCEVQLNKVGREVHLQGFTSALIFPRVLQLLKEMRFWKKSKIINS